MAWVYLFTAALFEMGWAIGLKYVQGFTKLWPSVLTITAMAISLGLTLAVRTIPVGTGYAIWTGIGAVSTAILGIVLGVMKCAGSGIDIDCVVVHGLQRAVALNDDLQLRIRHRSLVLPPPSACGE